MSAWPEGVDRIAITGIKAHGTHGVLASERERGQDFIVDVVLGVDTRKAAAGDDLTQTVDYSAVAVDVAALISGEPFNLIETLADRIATTILTRPRVRGVEVSVHKPHAPIDVAFDDVIVTISRWR